jgi:hypothetical protein
MSGLRRASIPLTKLARPEQAGLLDKHGLEGKGKIKKTIRLRYKALAQKLIEIAKTARRIVVFSLGR